MERAAKSGRRWVPWVRGRGFYIDVFGDETQEAAALAHLDRAAGQVESCLTFNGYKGASDHAPFHRRGLPSVMLSWEDPKNVHAPEDRAEAIDPDKLRATGRVAALAVMTMADE